MKFGIIGFGRFGQLLAKALTSFGKVTFYDTNPNIKFVTNNLIAYEPLSEIVTSDFLFLLVPISAFDQCCRTISAFLPSETVIVECCSVKMYPIAVMQKILSKKQSRIATHPLFGPDSVKSNRGFSGHTIVLCQTFCKKTKYKKLKTVFQSMGLNIIVTTPKAHDQQMALSQGLVHLIGRGLDKLNLKELSFSTPDFKSLQHIKAMVMNDQLQLFLDMHRYNPYTKNIRKKLINQLRQLDNQIN